MVDLLQEQNPEKIYTVSELNHWARMVLTESMGDLWLCGEISNLTVKSESGHVYFVIGCQQPGQCGFLARKKSGAPEFATGQQNRVLLKSRSL